MNCGNLIIEFFNHPDETTLDTDIFLVDGTMPGPFNLAVKYTEDVSKVNVYPIKYRVYHDNYAS